MALARQSLSKREIPDVQGFIILFSEEIKGRFVCYPCAGLSWRFVISKVRPEKLLVEGK